MIIKVCGMRDPENIRQVEALDIDWMGFIFYPKSPRCVLEEKASEEAIRRCWRHKVGVFVNDTVQNMGRIAENLNLQYLQLHGSESPEICVAMQQRGYKIVKAFPIASADDLKRTKEYVGCVDYFLFDTKCEGYGGSGEQFDWSVLEDYKEQVPFLLSGGLSPDCAEELNQFQHPQFAGVDLNSGFETAPGLKDVEKLKFFISKLKI